MIELLDPSLKINLDYIAIDYLLVGICEKSHGLEGAEGLMKSHYMLDYPWLFLHTPITPKSKVLDAGCGRGVFQIFLANKCELYTVDRRGFHIEEWSKEKEKQFNVKLNFSCQDLKNTNYEDNFFDHIVSCSSLEHNSFEDAKLIFKELERILKPGGRIVFTLVAWREFKVLYGNAKDPIIMCYTDEKIKELIEGTNLKLLSDENNFDQFEDLIKKFCKEYPMYGADYIPVGVVFQKDNV